MRLNRNQLPEDVLSELAAKDNTVDVDTKISSIASTASASTKDSGDIAILSFDNEAPTRYSLQNGVLDTVEIDGIVGYQDRLTGGYIFTGASPVYRNNMFNRIKVFVSTPGWVRIGIVRGTGNTKLDGGDGVARGIFKASPRYDNVDIYPTSLVTTETDTTADGKEHTSLVKWLVVQYAATPGSYEYDFEDTTISSPYEYIFAESRTGSAGFVMNMTGADLVVGDITYPSACINTGLTYPTAYGSTTNNATGSYFVSNDMLHCSARFTYHSSKPANGGGYKRSWSSSAYNAAERGPSYSIQSGDLNLGIYKRGVAGDKYLDPLCENAINRWSMPSSTRHIRGYGPTYASQQKLATQGSRIYAVEVIVAEAGDLSGFVFSSNDPATVKVRDHFTLRVRGIGKQRIHLPYEIVLQPGEWMGFCGATEAVSYSKPIADTVFSEGTTLATGYVDTCKPVYVSSSNMMPSNWECFGDDETGVKDLIPYSSAIEERSTGTFSSWSGTVQYVPGENAGEGDWDFSEATFSESAVGFLNIAFVVRDAPISALEDKWCSITGDSISTYAGVVSQTTDFGVTVNAAGDNSKYYPGSGKGLTSSIDTTWWGALIKQTRMRLLRNDAWSGSRVAGTDSTTSSSACASAVRVAMLKSTLAPYTPITTEGALGHPYGTPEIIFTMIGTNDLAGAVSTGAYSNSDPGNIETILTAFQTMVARHKAANTQSKLVYFLIPRGTSVYPYVNANDFSLSQMAASFEYICKAMGVHFVPLSYFTGLSSAIESTTGRQVWSPSAGYITRCVSAGSGITTDSLHPNATGHQIIANGLQAYCESHL